MTRKSFLLCFLFSYYFVYSENISIYTDNDFPFNTDRYYTHGWGITYATDKIDSLGFINLFSIANNNLLTQFSLNQQIFTPSNTNASDFQKDDFPYSGLLFFKLSTLGNSNNWFFITNYSIGIIGKYAYGKETQEAIHSFTAPSLNPKGWDEQLQNDLLMNIDIIIQRELIDFSLFTLNGIGAVGAGTLNNYIGTGMSLNKVIHFNPDFQIGFSVSDFIKLSLYDTKLRGTFLFNPQSALNNNRINPVFNTVELSTLISIYDFQFILVYTQISKQIKNGYNHKYLTFKIDFGF